MKAVAYLRTAIAENNGSIESQKKAIEDFLNKNPEYEVHDCYIDEGVSGVTPFDKRPEGKCLLEDAKAGKFQAVLVTRIDRLGRDFKIVLETVKNFDNLNIGIKSLSGPLDTTTIDGWYMFNTLCLFSEYERKMLSEKIKQGIRNKRNAKKVAIDNLQ